VHLKGVILNEMLQNCTMVEGVGPLLILQLPAITQTTGRTQNDEHVSTRMR
jgi:hypothetical protein